MLLVTVISTAVFAADSPDTEVKGIIEKFQEAVERHDVAAVWGSGCADVVVLENGHRNDGWIDFRDNHLIPEFKGPTAPSKWGFVKVISGPDMAWGYTKQALRVAGKNSKYSGYLVWSVYVLHKTSSAWKMVLLDWSARQLSAEELDLIGATKRIASSPALKEDG